MNCQQQRRSCRTLVVEPVDQLLLRSVAAWLDRLAAVPIYKQAGPGDKLNKWYRLFLRLFFGDFEAMEARS